MTLSRNVPLKRGGRLRAMSKRRRAENAGPYAEAKAIVAERDGGRCQAAEPHFSCSGPLHPHHVWPVGAGGPRCDPSNIITLCQRHHRWVHDVDPRRARELGLLR
jgi:hypothetical protein